MRYGASDRPFLSLGWTANEGVRSHVVVMIVACRRDAVMEREMKSRCEELMFTRGHVNGL